MRRRATSEPDSDELARNAIRSLAGAALVVLAAGVVHAAGHVDQQWQYVAIAAALIPQILVNLLAIKDAARRAALRVTRAPRLVLLIPAVVLAIAGPATWWGEGSAVPALAALCAAAGLAVASWPATIRFA